MYCTTREPRLTVKTLPPKKQTIRNALRDPKDIGNLGRSHHDTQMPSKIQCPKRKAVQAPLFRGRRVLGNGLGAFRDSVLGQLTGQDEANTIGVVSWFGFQAWIDDIRGLDLARGDGGLLVVGSKLGSLGGDALEDVCVTR